MTEFRINRASQHLAIDFFKLLGSVAKGDDLRGTNKGKIKGVEEKENIFSFV